MLVEELINHFEKLLSEKIIKFQPLSGGDINQVYVLSTLSRNVVVKINDALRFPGMFKAEANGLIALQKSKSFKIPKIISFGELECKAFLLLEYIQRGQQSKDFSETFGKQLANLHQENSSDFGFPADNYIGSLKQHNSICSTASEFYITQRLRPQFRLARENGFLFKEEYALYKILEKNIPNEKPSLIHGDLWNGNFIVDDKEVICLIDPAVAYAPREMDIAMMHLFGGFESKLFDVYNDFFPLVKDWENRLQIWQLYYVLVHLNIFGDAYYPQVKNILKSYS